MHSKFVIVQGKTEKNHSCQHYGTIVRPETDNSYSCASYMQAYIQFTSASEIRLRYVLFCSVAVLNPTVGHTMDGRTISIYLRHATCHSTNWLTLPACYAEKGLCIYRASVCPSVSPIRPSHAAAAAGLLLWARRTRDIDRLLHSQLRVRENTTLVELGLVRTLSTSLPAKPCDKQVSASLIMLYC